MLTQPEETADEVGVNLIELFARVEYDRELLQDMYGIFVEEFPKLYELLHAAVVTSDFEQIQTNAHTLKGMLASLSFRKASATAMRIEKMAQLCDLTGVPAEVQLLERDALLAGNSLEKFCAQAS